jgi:hypothetical protein
VQRCYLEGLQQDGTLGEQDDGELPPGFEPTVRENVDAGTEVIDLAAMRDQLEADRKRRMEGGA